jgi:hypothetical protein
MQSENTPNQQTQNQIQAITNIAQVSHEQVAHFIKQSITKGEVSPIDIYIALKRMEKIVEGVKNDKEIKDIVLEATEKAKDGGKSYERMGATLTTGAVYTWYDFTDCNDPLWTELKTIEEEIKNRLKQREEMLKALIPKANQLTVSKTSVNIEELPTISWEPNGETVLLNPPVKKQSQGVKVTFKKYQ